MYQTEAAMRNVIGDSLQVVYLNQAFALLYKSDMSCLLDIGWNVPVDNGSLDVDSLISLLNRRSPFIART